ncbi:LLM class flavin-dependent oxidoreductase [Streptomyces sp. NPDC002143]
MRLSVVDLSPLAEGIDGKQALADSVRFAQHVERLGFHRIWFAEHHGIGTVASHHPELLISAVGAQTSHIRVGSGAVLMNNYSPFKVAEMFKQLEAMFPGRVDLGMGRATSGPILDMALQRDREAPAAQASHAQQVAETLSWLYGAFPDGHPFARARIMPTVPEIPQTWLLGSTPSGSNLAAGLGIGYTFAGFINPLGAAGALRNYRQQFQPQFGLGKPRAILAVNVTVGETAADAARLVSSPKAFYARLSRGGDINVPVPFPDAATSELTRTEWEQPTAIVDGRWPRLVAGDPKQVRATLEQMAEESGADEIMVQNMIPDPADRHRSHSLLAEAFGLTPPTPTTAAVAATR